VDIRVSILPTIYGEKAVLRLLTTGKNKIDFESLGMEPHIQDLFLSVLKRPHGLILVSGPTGSGKSTALYASLLTIQSPEVNITTVEDPVEYKIDGITQVQVHHARKVTFANALRAILRQDPDIIMVGEIRDRETAEIAIQASLTGHLVLTTIHTNDAPSALTRLIEIGCEPYLISSAVIGAMAQRLVRLTCESCSETFQPSLDEFRRFGYADIPRGIQWARGTGCRRCDKSGYKGRTGIYEFMKMDRNIRQEVIKRSPADLIREIAVSNGMKTLQEDGLIKVNRKQTTPEEVLRVTVLE
jgi:type IV pilus assembly protein PilB